MNRTFTCILCPNGCEISVSYSENDISSVSGNKCLKGTEYVEQEIRHPVRTIASSVLVEGGSMPLCSVRLSAPVPKGRIFDVMAEIRKIRVTAPVRIGDTVIEDCAGTGISVIATKNVESV